MFGKKKYKKVKQTEPIEEEIEPSSVFGEEPEEPLEEEESEPTPPQTKEDKIAFLKKQIDEAEKEIENMKKEEDQKVFIRYRTISKEEMFNVLSDRLDNLELAIGQVVQYLKKQ